jgi:hypothetical protein
MEFDNAQARKFYQRARTYTAPSRQHLVTSPANVHYGWHVLKIPAGEGSMDELIGRLATELGIDRSTAETAVGIVLDFLSKEGPPDKIKLLLAKLPGADALIQKAASAGGGSMGGVMGAGMAMMGAGLSMGQVQDLTRQFIAFARGKVGEDAVGEIVAAIPGLSQFV